jgi:hypothetical protein
MSTAFLLTSNRRKLFQEKMRQKHSALLDDEIIIPPPCLRYLPELERLRRKPRTPLINSQNKNESSLQHESVLEMDLSPEKILSLETSRTPELPTPRKSRKRRRSPNSQDVIDDETQPVKELKIDPDSFDEQKEDPKEDTQVQKPVARPISLFLRARRNSFPPLHGCYAHHGLTFWQGY